MSSEITAAVRPVPGFFWAKRTDAVTVVEVVRIGNFEPASYVALLPGDATPVALDALRLLEGPLLPPQARTGSEAAD